MTNMTTGEQVADLTRELEKLGIQQDELNNRGAETRSRVTALNTIALREQQEQRTTGVTERVGKRTEAVKGSGYFIGDQVDIRNPSRGQELQGTVVGRTKDNLLRILTKSGATLRRIPKNVRRS